LSKSTPSRNKTLRDLARAARLSVSGTSYALRAHPSIPAKTVERVRRLAEKIGYRSDLRVATLMSHIRRQQSPRARETLAFVWVSTYRHEVFPAYHRHYLNTVLAGARLRAEQLGCTLAEFWLEESGMTPRRLEEILKARGITGVVFSPAMHDLAVTLDWDWSAFACAIIGNTDWRPNLHRAGHHHYRSMWLTLQRLRDEGCVRPAAILSRSIHERIHGVHLAAFQVNHPAPLLAGGLTQFALPEQRDGLHSWTRRHAPDALIIGWPVTAAAAAALSALAPTARRVVTLDWQPDGALPGMDVGNDIIAANAVELVVAQLHRNERGVPAHPATHLIEGVWRE
jgi:LacI family transcriptional regulator